MRFVKSKTRQHMYLPTNLATILTTWRWHDLQKIKKEKCHSQFVAKLFVDLTRRKGQLAAISISSMDHAWPWQQTNDMSKLNPSLFRYIYIYRFMVQWTKIIKFDSFGVGERICSPCWGLVHICNTSSKDLI